MAILISRSFSQCYAMLGAYEEYGRTLSSKTEQFEKYLDLKTQRSLHNSVFAPKHFSYVVSVCEK